MNTIVLKRTVKTILALIILISLTQGLVFCQSNQNPKQKTLTPTQTLSSDQTATIKKILSKYNPSNLTAADARAIHEQFRAAGIHAGPENRDAIIAAGFDPDKLRTLDPPPDDNNQGRRRPPSDEERMKNAETMIIQPLSLNASQNEVVTKAFKDFYSEMDNLMKTQEDPRTPIDKSKIEPLEKKRDEKIKQVLSQGQFMKYQELEKAARPYRPEEPAPKQK
jgi:hypothetical protein